METKSLSFLLQDLRNYFRTLHGNNDSYESFSGPCLAEVTKLDIKDSEPLYLLLMKWRDKEEYHQLVLTSVAPTEGHNERFEDGFLLEIHAKFNGSNHLWIDSDDSIKRLHGVIELKKSNEKLCKFRLKLINKTHDLFYSGIYA